MRLHPAGCARFFTLQSHHATLVFNILLLLSGSSEELERSPPVFISAEAVDCGRDAPVCESESDLVRCNHEIHSGDITNHSSAYLFEIRLPPHDMSCFPDRFSGHFLRY